MRPSHSSWTQLSKTKFMELHTLEGGKSLRTHSAFHSYIFIIKVDWLLLNIIHKIFNEIIILASHICHRRPHVL
jgi:hypothetical protein